MIRDLVGAEDRVVQRQLRGTPLVVPFEEATVPRRWSLVDSRLRLEANQRVGHRPDVVAAIGR